VRVYGLARRALHRAARSTAFLFKITPSENLPWRVTLNGDRSHHLRQHETIDGHAFNTNPREECAQMLGKSGQIGERGMVAAVAPRARLAVRPEKGEYSCEFGVHLVPTSTCD
jgi:hypothetical protein